MLLFDLSLEVGGKRILSAYYGLRNGIPELERFIGQLLLKWWDNLGDRVQGIEVDNQVLLLLHVSMGQLIQCFGIRTATFANGLLPRV